MTVREALAEGRKRLRVPSAGAETSALDAALLLAECLGTDRTGLSLIPEKQISPPAEETLPRYLELLERRARGEPVAYILGRKEFRGLDFAVNPAVLIPRPDTETLVETALLYLDAMRPEGAKILDLCTGSGAVAISLKHERPSCSVYAADISRAALDLAAANAERLLGGGAADGTHQVVFIESDLFADSFFGAFHGEEGFGLILSNPPYVERGRIPELSREVRREPLLALDGGEDGLDILRRIIAEAPGRLAPGGSLLLEADPGQMPAIAKLLVREGFLSVRTFPDLSGQERVIAGTLPER